MLKIILHWIFLSLAVLTTTFVVAGISLSPLWVTLIVGACLYVFNLIVKPIINLLTLPINILTLGIFSLVINGTIIKGFHVETFYAAFIGALIVSVINWFLKKVFQFGE